MQNYLFTYYVLNNQFLIISAKKKHHKCGHFFLLLKFFLFNVVLVTLDIITDFLTAINFFSRREFKWGLLTTVTIFSSLILRTFLDIYGLLRCLRMKGKRGFQLTLNRAKFDVLLKQLPHLVWHFPLLHPIR